jgi:hypothetical protein
VDLKAAKTVANDLAATGAGWHDPRAGSGPDQFTGEPQGISADRSRRFLQAHFDLHALFILEHLQGDPGLRAKGYQDLPLGDFVVSMPFAAHLSARNYYARPQRGVGHRGGKQIRGARRPPANGAAHACPQIPTRFRSSRKKFIRHEPSLRLRPGHTRGSMPSPHITPITHPLPTDPDSRVGMPGPIAGERSLGPGTGACPPGKAPPCSREINTPARSVTGWMDSSYLACGSHTTRRALTCLVTSTGISVRFPGSSRAR